MTNEQAKDKVTVTVTKNGEQVFSTAENIVFIVGEHAGLMAADCTAVELFTFAPRILEQFLKNIITPLLADCKPHVTAEMLFDKIAEFAKEVATE